MEMLGDFKEGQNLYKKGLRLALEIKDITALSILEANHGLDLVLYKGDAENGMKHLQSCIRYCEEGQMLLHLGLAWTGLGWGYYLLGELETAREHMEKGLKMHRDMGLPFFLPLHYCALSLVHFDSGDLKSAQRCAEQALTLSQDNNEKWYEGISGILLGRVLGKAEKSQYAKAEEYILQGIKIFEERKLKPLSSRGYLYLGELYADTRQTEKALEYLKKAEGMFQEMGIDYWLCRTQEVLERVEG